MSIEPQTLIGVIDEVKSEDAKSKAGQDSKPTPISRTERQSGTARLVERWLYSESTL